MKDKIETALGIIYLIFMTAFMLGALIYHAPEDDELDDMQRVQKRIREERMITPW